MSSTLSPWLRVVLVGFMGSGKSRVGRELGRLLDWAFVDVDREVERLAGRTIPEIFRMEGEDAFRSLEGEVTRALLEREQIVLATGGGWPTAAPGRMEGLPPGSFSVWLRVSPEEAIRRIRTGRGRARPLLEVEDPLGEARRLLALREPVYSRAHLTVEVGKVPPRSLALEIRERLMDRGSPMEPRREG